jgi:hypothetical protein
VCSILQVEKSQQRFPVPGSVTRRGLVQLCGLAMIITAKAPSESLAAIGVRGRDACQDRVSRSNAGVLLLIFAKNQFGDF